MKDEEPVHLENDLDPAELEAEQAAADARADRVNRWLNANQSYAKPNADREGEASPQTKARRDRGR